MKIFARVALEPYAIFKVRKTELFLTMPHTLAYLLWQMPHRVEGEVKQFPTNALGGGGGHRRARN